MSLGLQRGTVQLAEYNPAWQEEFKKEKEALEALLGNEVLGIEHIGSTSIPGIKAKPILDLEVAVDSLDNWERFVEPLKQLSYQLRFDFREDKGHVLFVKGPEENRTHYLKLTELGSNFWNENILFRDYLIAHPEYRRRYEKLKEDLVHAFEGKREPYTEAKADFIREVLTLAVQEK